MTVSYFARLLLLCLAAFCLVYCGMAAAVAAVAGRVVRRAERMRARDGARLLFILRILPSAAGVLVAIGWCAPSYLWLEADAGVERLGTACVAAAAIGAALWTRGIVRAAGAAMRSSRYLRSCESALESDRPLLMLGGVLRPRLLVSRGVRRALTADELAVALRHERAHGESRDNLKRLLMLLAPEALGARRLEQGWGRLAEWAADDRAVEGSRQRSLALASALVRVARMGTASLPEIATPFLGSTGDLPARIERLLEEAPAAAPTGRPWIVIAAPVVLAAIACQPASLAWVHRALETLAH